ncbi:hypothetical protein UY3_02972 [Chelonia mydas]|uniref:GIY-YIG domain-containing protein n=1 Tax=Chelonia mydas TaxID=8469 RepID=M7BPE6_CHEMY|nr:hypothetical protein UY3_02972 [Chelonia mydas]
MYIGQTGQSLRKRINGHKSDVKNYNIHKPVGDHFNLSGHVITDMKVAILQQKNFKTRLQQETAELEFICKLDTINLGLNRDREWLSHYARYRQEANATLWAVGKAPGQAIVNSVPVADMPSSLQRSAPLPFNSQRHRHILTSRYSEAINCVFKAITGFKKELDQFMADRPINGC